MKSETSEQYLCEECNKMGPLAQCERCELGEVVEIQEAEIEKLRVELASSLTHRDCYRWRDCDGDEQPERNQKIRVWVNERGEWKRSFYGNWAQNETHWRPLAQGPGGEG